MSIHVIDDKEFWKSKTFWINSAMIAGGLLTAVAGELHSGGAVTIMGLVNIILRVLTKNGIKF